MIPPYRASQEDWSSCTSKMFRTVPSIQRALTNCERLLWLSVSGNFNRPRWSLLFASGCVHRGLFGDSSTLKASPAFQERGERASTRTFLRGLMLYISMFDCYKAISKPHVLVKFTALESCNTLNLWPLIAFHGSPVSPGKGSWLHLSEPLTSGPGASILTPFQPPTLKATPALILAGYCPTPAISTRRVPLSNPSLSSFQNSPHTGSLIFSRVPGSRPSLLSFASFQTFLASHSCHASSPATLMGGQRAWARNKLFCL